MTSINERYPIEDVEIEGQKFEKSSFMRIWEEAWFWMEKWGLPLNNWQKDRIKGLTDCREEPSKLSMAYYITEHCEHLSNDKIPEEFKPIILEYKIHMMNQWGWPEWGYKDVKHLKPQGENHDRR